MDSIPDPWIIIRQSLGSKAAGYDLSSEQEDVLRLACELAVVEIFVSRGIPADEVARALEDRSHQIGLVYDPDDETVELRIEWTDR